MNDFTNTDPRYAASRRLFERALEVLPGGVNSPVRAFRGVGGTPLFIARGDGAIIVDVDGNEYLDFVGSWGPLIAGHAHPHVREAVHRAVDLGFSFGAPTDAETELACMVVDRVPGVEMVRLVNSGTEATMSAVRLARASTGRDRLMKFAGCYHGHADCFLVSAGSGALDIGHPDSPGVPHSVVGDTLVARFNDVASVESLFEHHAGEVAAVIVEPVGGNAGCIPPRGTFLEDLRTLCDRHGALLIFDEVMTGFRIARGGAAERFGVVPDLYTFGKVIGGGFPIGAYAGPRSLMRQIAPSGPVYQAGTLSGNPIAVAAGKATLELLDDSAYAYLERLGGEVENVLTAALTRHGWPITVHRVGSMFSLFFTPGPVTCVDDVTASDRARFSAFFHGLLADGVYIAPSAYESSFLSLAHNEDHISTFVEKCVTHLNEVFSSDKHTVQH